VGAVTFARLIVATTELVLSDITDTAPATLSTTNTSPLLGSYAIPSGLVATFIEDVSAEALRNEFPCCFRIHFRSRLLLGTFLAKAGGNQLRDQRLQAGAKDLVLIVVPKRPGVPDRLQLDGVQLVTFCKIPHESLHILDGFRTSGTEEILINLLKSVHDRELWVVLREMGIMQRDGPTVDREVVIFGRPSLLLLARRHCQTWSSEAASAEIFQKSSDPV